MGNHKHVVSEAGAGRNWTKNLVTVSHMNLIGKKRVNELGVILVNLEQNKRKKSNYAHTKAGAVAWDE